MRKKLCDPLAACLAACVLLPNAAVLAATPTTTAGSVLRDSQQTERALPERPAPKVTVETEVKPPMVGEQGFRAFVKSYRISGQDTFPEETLVKLLAPYSNREMTMAELQEAANVLARYFRDHGYFVAQAYLPVQEIEDDTVEISVVVGRCGEIILKNHSQASDAAILQQLTAIKRGAYIQTETMERAALLAGDLAGVSAHLTLIPGKAPGSADIVVEANPKGKAMQGSLSESNWGTRLTGYNQTNLNLALSNPVQMGDNLSGSLTKTFSGQDTGNVNYRIPLGEGSVLNLGYSKVSYELGKEMTALDVHGTAYTQHADWTYALKRSRGSNFSVQVGYDSKRMKDYIDEQGYDTSARSHMTSLGLLGDSTDNWLGRGGANAYNVLWYAGSTSGANNTGATMATGNWNKATYSFMRQQYLQERWSLFFSLSGQVSDSNLDSSEKFSLGGANGVRAYPSGEAAGDEAWLATAELRYTLANTAHGSMWQLAAFYDTGASHIEKNPTVATDQNRRSLSGAGLGVSYIKPDDYSIKLNYAWKVGSEAAQSDTTFGNGRLWVIGTKYF